MSKFKTKEAWWDNFWSNWGPDTPYGLKESCFLAWDAALDSQKEEIKELQHIIDGLSKAMAKEANNEKRA